jgi:hypothetical protein
MNCIKGERSTERLIRAAN